MDPATEPFGQVEVKAGDAATASKTKANFRIAVTTVRDKPEPLARHGVLRVMWAVNRALCRDAVSGCRHVSRITSTMRGSWSWLNPCHRGRVGVHEPPPGTTR